MTSTSRIRTAAYFMAGLYGISPEKTVRLTNGHKEITNDLGRLRAAARKLQVGDRSGEAMLFTHLAESLSEHFRREEQLLFSPAEPLFRLGSGICERLNNERAEIIAKLSVQTGPLEESFRHLEQLLRAHLHRRKYPILVP